MAKESSSTEQGLMAQGYPKHTVDLDLPPSKRWLHVAQANKEAAQIVEKAYKKSLWQFFGCFGWLVTLPMTAVHIPREYKLEMKGLADALGMDYTTILGLNIGYDAITCCTGAVVRLGGRTYHLRNMEWDLPELQQLTMEITFTRGGKPLFTSVGWLGFIGTFTAISRQGYSVSLNFRKGGGSHVPHLLKTIFAKKAISTFTVRDLLVHQLPFEEFLSALCSADLLAPCYWIVADTTTGAILSCGRGVPAECKILHMPVDLNPGLEAPAMQQPGTEQVQAADSQVAVQVPASKPCCLASSKLTAIVQTNHDWWTDGKVNRKKWGGGDHLLVNTEERSACARNTLASLPIRGDESMQEACSLLAQVLCKPPVNDSQTLYSVIMIPSEAAVVRVK